eukprot:1445431-Alexandrium_andersonii.AAC.1
MVGTRPPLCCCSCSRSCSCCCCCCCCCVAVVAVAAVAAAVAVGVVRRACVVAAFLLRQRSTPPLRVVALSLLAALAQARAGPNHA